MLMMQAGRSPCINADSTQYFDGLLDEIQVNFTKDNPWIGDQGQVPMQVNNPVSPATPWGKGLGKWISPER